MSSLLAFHAAISFWKRSYISTPCILRLIGDLRNSQAHKKLSWVRIGILICLRVCWYSHSLYPPLWKPLRWDFWRLIEWAQSTGTRQCHYLILCNHSLLACLLSSTNSCPLFLGWCSQCWSHCHWLLLASISKSPECTIEVALLTSACIVLCPSSCSPWQSVQGSHTQNSFLSWAPSWSHAPLPKPLNRFVSSVSVMCSHGCAAAFSSTLWSSLPGWSFPLEQNFQASKADHSVLRRWRASLRLLPLLLLALWPTPVLWRGCCPVSQNPRAVAEQAAHPKVTAVGVSTHWNLARKIFQAFAPSPMPSSPIQSCLIRMRVFVSRVSARWHNTLFRFSLMSETSFTHASFSTLWFFFSSLLALSSSGAG